MDTDLNLGDKISSVGSYEIYTINNDQSKKINISKEISSVGNFKICTIKNKEKILEHSIKYKICSNKSNNLLCFRKM
jgi:hypothetical protein